jgi:5,10-methylene-tetrahydrofolate dehydrogenase/methenyl tetrahydrofolate cyclohydrolase
MENKKAVLNRIKRYALNHNINERELEDLIKSLNSL